MGRRASVRAYVATQVEQIRGGDALLRAAEPESVHDARVAVRRLRSMLRVFPALAEVAPSGLADGLRGWSDQLGGVRDLEAVCDLLADVCPRPLWQRLRPSIDAELAGAMAALDAALESPAHRQLLEDAEAFALAEPGPLRARAHVRRAARSARRRLEEAGEDPDLLHRARRAAKRARYAAEAVGDISTAQRWEAVQGRLGAYHDCVVALARLVGEPGDDAAYARQRLCDRMRAVTPLLAAGSVRGAQSGP